MPKVGNETRRRRDAEEEDGENGPFAPFSLRLRVSAFHQQELSQPKTDFRYMLLVKAMDSRPRYQTDFYKYFAEDYGLTRLG